MGRFPPAIALALGLWIGWHVGAALAQEPVERLIGVAGDAYVAVTPTQAVTAGLPGQSGNADSCLRTSGSALSWGACGGGGTALPPFTSADAREHLAINGAGSALEWVAPPVPLKLSDAAPQPTGTAAAGSGATASRADHVHASSGGGTATPLSNATPAALGAAAPGTASAASRGDHVHPTPIPTLTGHGGNCLKANSAATGLEFAACGGGGGASSVTIFTGTANISSRRRGVGIDTTGDGATTIVTALKGAPAGILAFVAKCSTETYSMLLDFNPASIPATGTFGFSAGANDTSASFQRPAYLSVNAARTTVSIYQPTPWDTSGSCTVSLTVYPYGGGGGGGGSNPSIPKPTAAGALQHLRVNAAGAAYELADPPDISGLPDIVSTLDGLQALTFDLQPYGPGITWAKPLLAATAAIQLKPQSENSASIKTSGTWSTSLDKPASGWPDTNQFVAARLPTGANLSQFRVNAQSDDGYNLYAYANSWDKLRTTGGFDYFNTRWASADYGVIGAGVASFVAEKASSADHDGETIFDGALGPTAIASAEEAIIKTVQGSATPKLASGSGAVGTATKLSREDHVHPAQDVPSNNDIGARALAVLTNQFLWRNIGTAKSPSSDQSNDFTLLYTTGEVLALRTTLGRATNRPGRLRILMANGEKVADCQFPGPSSTISATEAYQGSCVGAVPEAGAWTILLDSERAGNGSLRFFKSGTSGNITTSVTFQLQYRYQS